MTPENLRYHAAGHLAVALELANIGYETAARHALTIIGKYVNHETVDAPQALKDKVALCIDAPKAHVRDIELLEQWFVDPLNTQIENNGGKF